MSTFELVDRVVNVRQVRQLSRELISRPNHLGQSWTILPLQTLQKGQTFFDFLESRRGRLDPIGVPTEKRRKVLELRFDAVAGLEVRPKPGFDRGQLRDPPPDLTEIRQ